MGRRRLPLLHDHHSHGSLYAALFGLPDLSDLGPAEGRRLLESLPRDRLTLVKGRRSAVHVFDAADLNRFPPALILDFSLHGFLCTEAALPFLETASPEIAGRRFDREWAEKNVSRLFAAYIDLAGLDEAKLAAFFAQLETLGTGSTEDMSVSAEAFRIVRASAFLDRFDFWMAPEEYGKLTEPERSGVRGLKLYLDGSLGARTAAIAGSYPDGGEGLLTYADEELAEAAAEFGPVCGLSLHAIGERAIGQALEAVRPLVLGGRSCREIRLEHVQFITEPQAREAKDLGIVLSMQPNFTSDSTDYADRLEPGLRAANNPFRMLIDRAGFLPGEDLLFGSDGMPHGPAYAFRCSLSPPYEGQRLTVDELVAGYGEARGLPGGRKHFELLPEDEVGR